MISYYYKNKGNLMKDNFSTKKYFQTLDKYLRASNYISLAQLYLLDNPLLRDHDLSEADIKKKLVGHWGTVPGQNFIYTHLNRAVVKYNLNAILLSGPGHGGNFLTSNCYLEGTYSEVYPEIAENKAGLTRFCKQFSFPGGIGSHCVPETPGSIHEGGELGYTLAHAFGAVLDNPTLIATAIVGDGEAETGPLATSWHGNKFINPLTDGAVLPILHLNGFKINNPTVLSRISKQDLTHLLNGYGYDPIFVEGTSTVKTHPLMAKAMDYCIEKITAYQTKVRTENKIFNFKWPMIVLRTPKGWTCPKMVDSQTVEGSYRAHQVPVKMDKPEHLKVLETWLKSYKADELFDENYRLKEEIKAILPKGNSRISANPNANGGLLLKEIKVPKWEKFAVKVKGAGTVKAQDMRVLGGYIKELYEKNPDNYRIFSPDEAASNRLYEVLNNGKKMFNANIMPTDDGVANNGRIMDAFLSEHLCEGILEGYLLTGRHGMFNSYEAFIRVVESMISQHGKWLNACQKIEWRADISSLNLILTSNVWQQDHNGYTHQDPGFIDHLANNKGNIANIYLPADANSLLACYNECTKSKNKVNVIVASKHPTFQWLNAADAKEHFEKGAGEWAWAGMNKTSNPDLVVAGCGHSGTREALATVTLLKEYLPELNVKFVNVVDLLTLKTNKEHSHGLTDTEFNKLFTTNKPVLFNFHGYPNLIYSLTHNRQNKNFIVSGYEEEGTITTSFDMCVLNKTDRFNQVIKAVEALNLPKEKAKQITNAMKQKLKHHSAYIKEYGLDMPEILNWKWN